MSTEGLHEFGEETRKLYISYTTNDRKKKGGKVIASMRKARFSIKGKVQDVGYHPYKEILKRGRVRVIADIYKAELKDKPHRSSGEVGQSPCCGAELQYRANKESF